MPRIKSPITKQIRAAHWDPHETVLIRSLTTGDEEYVTNNLSSFDSSGKVITYAGRSKILTIQRGIVSWTLTNESGQRLEVTEAEIRNLAPDDSQFILDEINAISKALSVDEKKASTMPATPGIEAAAK